MPTAVLKLFAGQGTGRMDKAVTICFPLVIWWTRYRTDRRTKRRLYASPLGEHKNIIISTNNVLLNTYFCSLWSNKYTYTCTYHFLKPCQWSSNPVVVSVAWGNLTVVHTGRQAPSLIILQGHTQCQRSLHVKNIYLLFL